MVVLMFLVVLLPLPPMTILAIGNQKGGVGKTSTTVNLASVYVRRHGKRVLLVDLDGQANASRWLGAQDETHALFTSLTENGAPLPSPQPAEGLEGLEVLPASAALFRTDAAMAAAGLLAPHHRLGKILEGLGVSRWDLVLLDCPPNLGTLTINALAAAGPVLVPVEPSHLSLQGLAEFLRLSERVGDELNPASRLLGILLCKLRPGTIIAKDTRQLLESRFPELLLASEVPLDTRMTEAPSHRLPIDLYAPATAAAEAYAALAEEVLGRLEAPRG